MIHRRQIKGLQQLLYIIHLLGLPSDLTGRRQSRWRPPNRNLSWYTFISVDNEIWTVYSNVLRVQLSNVTGCYAERSNCKSEFRSGSQWTANAHISAHRHDAARRLRRLCLRERPSHWSLNEWRNSSAVEENPSVPKISVRLAIDRLATNWEVCVFLCISGLAAVLDFIVLVQSGCFSVFSSWSWDLWLITTP